MRRVARRAGVRRRDRARAAARRSRCVSIGRVSFGYLTEIGDNVTDSPTRASPWPHSRTPVDLLTHTTGGCDV